MKRIRNRNVDFKTVWWILISIVLVVVTFPDLKPVYANGIDPPLAWVFNYLIQGKLMLGKDIIFPHGPLAFVMYPLPVGANLISGILFQLVIRLAFSMSLLQLVPTVKMSHQIKAFLFLFILLALMDLLLVMVGLVMLGLLNYLKSKHSGWLMVSFLIMSLAIYIKAFVGIVCFLLTISFLFIIVFEVISRKRPVKDLLYFLVPIALIPAIWLCMYGTLAGLPRYFTGMMHLAGDNSAAVSYYPHNDWVVITSMIGLMVLLLLIHVKDSSVRYYYILIIPALFAVWKYGMAREDYLHAGMFFIFLVLNVLVLNLVINRRKLITTVISALLILFAYLSLRNSYYFEPPVFSVNGSRTLSGYILHYKFVTDTCNARSLKNIERNRLDPEIRNRIGGATADIFPWDYSYIPANGLNWLPRPVLQSYANYTPWLDEENAKHFSSESAPKFIIWELRKITHDIHGGTLESIDGRYLLNDQPEAMISLFTHYRLIAKQGGTFPVLLYERRNKPYEIERKILRSGTYSWDTWIDVPKAVDGILRANTTLSRNTLGDLKSFLYKDEACYIYYLLNNDQIRMFRIVPKNAEEGIWINPLFMNGEDDRIEPEVTRIMFRCTNPALMKGEIPLSWESIKIKEFSGIDSAGKAPIARINSLIGKNKSDKNTILFTSDNDLEREYPFWSSPLLPENQSGAFSGSRFCKVKAEGYSNSFELPVDSLAGTYADSLWLMRASVWSKTSGQTKAVLVISVENGKNSLFWKSVELEKFNIQPGTWNFACNFIEVPRFALTQKGTILKVYVWNIGKDPVSVDDFKVSIEH